MCTEKAKYRFTWPGQDESFICEKHVGKLKTISAAMGFYLQIIPLTEEELGRDCQQKGG